MNLWKWSYYCLNHDGICCFFRKLKTSFLAVKPTMSWKNPVFSATGCPSLPACQFPELDLVGVTAWNEFTGRLLGSGRLFCDSCASYHDRLSGESSQAPWTLPAAAVETPRHEWLDLGCASCLKAAKMCGIFLFPGNHQDISQGAKWKEETVKCGGCRVSLGSFPHSLCSQASRCCWNVSWCGYGTLWGHRAGHLPHPQHPHRHRFPSIPPEVTLTHLEQKVSLWVIAEPSRVSIDTPKLSLNFMCSVTSRMSCSSKNLFWARIPSWKMIKHWGNLIRLKSAVPSLGRWQRLGCSYRCELGHVGRSSFH